MERNILTLATQAVKLVTLEASAARGLREKIGVPPLRGPLPNCFAPSVLAASQTLNSGNSVLRVGAVSCASVTGLLVSAAAILQCLFPDQPL